MTQYIDFILLIQNKRNIIFYRNDLRLQAQTV